MELSKNLSDEELILLIAKNNAIAFKMLYNRYWKKMLTKAYTQLQSYTIAEEVVQDAFINLWKRRHTITLKYTFHTYIASVIRYEVMTQLAKKNKQPLYIDDLEIPAVADNATQQWLEFDELRSQIESLVDSLPDKCRLVFKLSRDKGLSDKQIAENLAISPKTVEAHISKALKILRLSLNNFICLTLFSCTIVYLAVR